MRYLIRVISGTHLEGRRKYNPGDRIETDKPLHELFANKFELLSNLSEEGVPITPELAPEPVINYEIRETARGWFDVVNSETGNAINARKLRDAEAKELLASLTDTGD